MEEYNFWLTEEINRCKLFNKDLTQFISSSTHPLHAKYIAKALINGVNTKFIKQLAETSYTHDLSAWKPATLVVGREMWFFY